MTNTDILISSIEKFIINNSLPDEYPRLPTILMSITPTLPAGIVFSDNDFIDSAKYLTAKFPYMYSYEDWYNTMISNLSTVTMPPDYLTDPKLYTTDSFKPDLGTGLKISTTTLLIGAALLILLLMPKSTTEA